MYYEDQGYPFTGRKRAQVEAFLQKEGLLYDTAVSYTANLVDGEGTIVASGSLDKNILKCIAVASEHQGEGLASRIVSRLIAEALARGITKLFLFTKPANITMFEDLGFYLIATTEEAALLENRRDGAWRYLAQLQKPTEPVQNKGSVVVNCNPFTRGHLYLIEQAYAQCDFLYVFVVEEDQSLFPTEVRLDLVRRGIGHLPNTVVNLTGDYMISQATFPTYFLKEQYRSGEISAELDLTIFAERIAKPLGISKRFVGQEPYDPVTSAYNQQMREVLAKAAINVLEIPRLTEGGEAISASRVRRLLAEGDWAAIRTLVPEVTYAFLQSAEGLKIAEKLADA